MGGLPNPGAGLNRGTVETAPILGEAPWAGSPRPVVGSGQSSRGGLKLDLGGNTKPAAPAQTAPVPLADLGAIFRRELERHTGKPWDVLVRDGQDLIAAALRPQSVLQGNMPVPEPIPASSGGVVLHSKESANALDSNLPSQKAQTGAAGTDAAKETFPVFRRGEVDSTKDTPGEPAFGVIQVMPKSKRTRDNKIIPGFRHNTATGLGVLIHPETGQALRAPDGGPYTFGDGRMGDLLRLARSKSPRDRQKLGVQEKEHWDEFIRILQNYYVGQAGWKAHEFELEFPPERDFRREEVKPKNDDGPRIFRPKKPSEPPNLEGPPDLPPFIPPATPAPGGQKIPAPPRPPKPVPLPGIRNLPRLPGR